MNWYQNLYIGKTASKDQKDIVSQIDRRENLMKVYLIAIAPDERNQLEIITPTVFYRQEKRYGFSPLIVGIAYGMSEARELLVQMAEDVYQATKTTDFRNYFLQ